MIKALERMGERMLGRVLPNATAKAFCTPWSQCVYCGGSCYREVYHAADCSTDYYACCDHSSHC
ncbi:hypothetical protein [Dactylosporangium sp. NPDC051541]|uniref:hypothetical protein n=1 Tax=Dactylosporangium sp. NPDC051541 TaxID=3363977 RepID=UPI0037A2C218